MKIIKVMISLFLLILVAGVLMWFFAPEYLKNIPLLKSGGVENDTLIEHARKHSDPNYVCPMHPQIVRGKPGNCPICGMNLVEKGLGHEEEDKPKTDKKAEKKIKFWVAPMDANYRRDKPGKSPMGMDLVPVYEEEDSDGDTHDTPIGEKKIKYWVAPMDANYRRNKPGKSPMGMDLVPVYEDGDSDSGDSNDGLPRIKIKSNTAQKMGIRTVTVHEQELSRTIHTIGSISYNEDTLYHVHSRTNGWIEKVYVKAEGDKVAKGKTLVDFYSPDIVAAQKDLLIAKRSGKLLSGKGSGSLLNSAKQKLRLLDVPERVITRIQSTGKSLDLVPIIAPQSGVITRMGLRDGMYVTPKLQMYTIADLSSVWVLVDVFEHQLEWVKVGNKAEMKVQGLPSETWTGKVDYIYPELNPVNRTLKIRLKFDTPKQRLKPNMFADVKLYSTPKKALSVPREAIIYYENSPRIVKVVGKYKYQPIEVKTGMRSEGQVEILEGLKEDDKVVVSGQFMIDSESNLQASFRRLAE